MMLGKPKLTDWLIDRLIDWWRMNKRSIEWALTITASCSKSNEILKNNRFLNTLLVCLDCRCSIGVLIREPLRPRHPVSMSWLWSPCTPWLLSAEFCQDHCWRIALRGTASDCEDFHLNPVSLISLPFWENTHATSLAKVFISSTMQRLCWFCFVFRLKGNWHHILT